MAKTAAMVPIMVVIASVLRGERQQEIWPNDNGAPIGFFSFENGTPIDFILTSPLRDAAIAEADPVPTAKLQSGHGD